MKENENVIEISAPVRVCSLCKREIAPQDPYTEAILERGWSSVCFCDNCRKLILLYTDILDDLMPEKAESSFQVGDQD